MSKSKEVAVMAAAILMYSCFAATIAAKEANNNDTALEEIVVTGSKLSPTKFTVVTEAEIKAKGAQNVAEALKDVAGLYVTGSNAKGKKIAQFRGSDADNTKIFIDGVPLSPVGDGRVDLSNIPTDNIAKIEIIKGAVPVIYGTDAPGGVIFITTKNGSNKTIGSVSIASGSWDTRKYSATFGGDIGKINYFFGVNKEKTDGYTIHAGKDTQSFNGKIKWDFDPKSSLTVYGSHSDTTVQIPNRYYNGHIYATAGQGGGIFNNNFFTGTYDWEYDPMKQSYIGALYNYKINDKNDINLKIYESNEKSTLNTNNPLLHDYWDGTVKGWELQHNIKTSKINTVTWGYAHETRNFTELAINKDKPDYMTAKGGYCRAVYDYDGQSFYIQNTTNVSRKLATSFGFRHYENHDRMDIDGWAYFGAASNGSALSKLIAAGVDPYHLRSNESSNDPVFSFNYAFNEKTALHGAIGKSYRFPNAKERAGVGGYLNGSSGEFSLYLLPETAINREVGLTHSFNPGLGFDITFFSKDITNMIKGQGQAAAHTQYENIPHVDMHGYEAEIHKKFNEHVKVFANYSYTNALDTWVHRQVADIPYRKFSYGLNFAGKDGINANLAVNYVGAVTSMFSLGNGNSNGDGPVNGGVRLNLPGYHVVDLKVSKAANNQEYYIKFFNLFDKQYNQGVYLVAPGRYTEVGATIKF